MVRGMTAAFRIPKMSFTATRLAIPEIILIESQRFGDARGYFTETYRAADFAALGVGDTFVQDNQAGSAKAGTVRGLHFQKPPHAQAKLIRVLKGAIFDVAVDIRRGSRTYGRWIGATLTAGGAQLYVPHGFAHGYCTLESDTEVAYKCDAYYNAGSEGGLLFSDPLIGIEWPLAVEAATVSDKDRKLPSLRDFVSPF